MPIHELQLLLQNHGVTTAVYAVAGVFALIALAAFLASIGIALGMRTPLTIKFVWGFSKWREQRRADREVARLLALFPVQTPAHEKQIFDALMSMSDRPRVVQFPTNSVPRI